MSENNGETSKNSIKHGLPFEEAIQSNQSIWSERLATENYDGNIPDAANWLTRFTEGMAYAFRALSKRNKVDNTKTLPRVDFDNLPEGFGIIFLKDYNTIVVPTSWLKEFEGKEPDNYVEQIDAIDGKTVQFHGEIQEYWFLTGVEELVHAVDPNIPNQVIHPHENVGTIHYHSQNHEYKALGWQVRAAIDNNFSEESISSSKDLLSKCIQLRFDQKHNASSEQ